MEESFKDKLEEIKKETVNPEETKKYILAIKRVLRKSYDNCKDEQGEEEILQEYLEDYNNDLKFRGEAHNIYNRMLMYSAYKRILQDFKSNKANFNITIREAREKELSDNISRISVNTDIKESMISVVRFVIRTNNINREKEILQAIQREESIEARYLRDKMIHIIRSSVRALNEYGFIDEYIAESNEELRELGLSQLQYEKRNPIADKQYDENGQLVKDVEDIGVIDTFAKDNLEKIPLEDLTLMTAFWESKYFQERLGLSKAMTTIKALDLWDTMLHKDDESINNLDNSLISKVLKKDLALTYLCRSGCKITGRVKEQYKNFLESEGISSDKELNEEIIAETPEVSNLVSTIGDIATLERLILHQLMTKELKIKKWGVIDNKPTEEELVERKNEENNGITIAVEDRNFRGALIMSVPEYILTDFFHMEESELPKYDKKLNETYCSIMSKLYLPTNNFFTNTVKKAYKENPQSAVLADLAGKKVQPPSGDER